MATKINVNNGKGGRSKRNSRTQYVKILGSGKQARQLDAASKILSRKINKTLPSKGKNQGMMMGKKNNLMLPVNRDTYEFIKAYMNPFCKGPISLPMPPLVSHQCVLSICNGTGVCNANGNGWIVVKPDRMFASDSGSGPVNCTTASGAPDDINPGTTGTAYFQCNSPYVFDDYEYGETPNKMARIAALGIRIRYTGTTLNSAGNCYSIQLESRTNESDLSGFSVATIKNQPAWKEFTFRDNEWHYLARQIQDNSDYDYLVWDGTSFCYAANPSIAGLDEEFNMGWYMAGCTAGAPFEFEVFCHFEVVGPDLPTRSVIKSDSVAVEQTISQAKTLRHDTTTKADAGPHVNKEDGKASGEGGGWGSFLKSTFDIAKTGGEIVGSFF